MTRKRKLEIKDAYFQHIIDLGFDYDGFESAENLKCLIDDLVDLAVRGLNNDDETKSYIGYEDNKTVSYNILGEKLK